MNPQSCAAAAPDVLDAAGLGADVDRRGQRRRSAAAARRPCSRPAAASKTWKLASRCRELGRADRQRQCLPGRAADRRRTRRRARIVITGRVADASLTVGPAVHEFGWPWDDWNRLAGGSVAGHLIECGAQATGGLYRHWQDLDLADVGYPIAEIDRDGCCSHHQAGRHRRTRSAAHGRSSSWFTRSAIRPIT